MHLKIFMWSYIVTALSLVVAFLYGSWSAVVLCVILGVLEVSLSFDNAVINATVLERMSDFWQKIFLTVGIVIAVFGMRLAAPAGHRLGRRRAAAGGGVPTGDEPAGRTTPPTSPTARPATKPCSPTRTR